MRKRFQSQKLRRGTLALIAVALLVAVTGGSAGAKATVNSADIKNNTILSKDIKNGTVVSKDIKDGTLTSGDIKNGTVTSSDIKDGTVTSGDIKNGTITLADISDSSEQQLRAGADTVVSDLAGAFTATNGTVSMTPDGVEFGPYADGAAAGGSIEYSGLDGMPLVEVVNLVYYARYTATGDTGGVGVPYLRIFLEDAGGVDHDAIFSPNTQTPDADTAEGPFHEWVATSGSWRYDDDEGTGPDMPFEQLVAEHGTETITRITISAGFSAGTDLSALLRWWQINGQTFSFGG